MILTETISARNIEELKKYTNSIFGKKPIEEEAKVFREVDGLLRDVYYRILLPISLTEEEKIEIKNRVEQAVRKLSEIM